MTVLEEGVGGCVTVPEGGGGCVTVLEGGGGGCVTVPEGGGGGCGTVLARGGGGCVTVPEERNDNMTVFEEGGDVITTGLQHGTHWHEIYVTLYHPFEQDELLFAFA